MDFSKKGTLDKQKYIKSTSRKLATKSTVAFFRFFLVSLILVLTTGIFIAFGTLKGIIDKAPSIDSINVAPTGFSTTIYNQKGKEIKKLVGSDANRVYRELKDIPKIVQQAFIAIEDARFYEHNGIDIKGIIRAGVSGLGNLLNGKDMDEGASTITQQLLKNQVFNGGNEVDFIEKLERKIQEQYLAIQLENKLSNGNMSAKDTILEYYLNSINLGQNTLGVQAACLRYFNKDVSEITLSEATVIAGITQNPWSYNPINYPEKNAEKRAIVLDYMQKQGYITKKQKKEALEDDVYSRIQLVNDKKYSVGSSVNSYFIDELIDQVQKDLQEKLGYSSTTATNLIYRGGLSIYSTQDTAMQKKCDEILQDENIYPAESEWELSYKLSVKNKKGKETHYSTENLISYFRFVKHLTTFDAYFSNKEDATPFIEEFKESVLSDSDKISGEVIDFTIQPQISFVVIDQHTGYVKAMVGGRGEKKANRTLNRASDSNRQPGSTFKILSTYLPALDTAGMTLATVQDDAPYSYPNGTPVKNYYSGYKGLCTLRQGIRDSLNIVTVKTLADPNLTPKTGYDYLLKLGFTTIVDSYTSEDGRVFSDIELPMALGGLTSGVTNLELTAAFSSIANNGVYIEPVLYTKIIDHDGKVLIDNTPQTRQVMKDSTAWLLTDAMQDVITSGTGTLTRFSNTNMAQAGKSGTTTNNIDLWFCGYTPYYTASIWSGYDHNKIQTNTSYHKILWKTLMEKLHEKKESKTFEKPSSIISATICTKCGKLAIEGVCSEALGGSCARSEYFAKGTVPTEKCNCHVKLKICSASGRPAGEYCPESSIIQKVYLIKEETASTADSPYILPGNLEETICNVHNSVISDDPAAVKFETLPEEEEGENKLTVSSEEPSSEPNEETTTQPEPTESESEQNPEEEEEEDNSDTAVQTQPPQNNGFDFQKPQTGNETDTIFGD